MDETSREIVVNLVWSMVLVLGGYLIGRMDKNNKAR